MQVDYIILGQGISGTFLSYYLQKAGKKIIVIDESKPFTASKAASGVINPVTGRRIVRTWMIEELLSFARKAYNEMGEDLNISVIKPCNVLDFHSTLQMKDAFDKRVSEENEFLGRVDDEKIWEEYFRFNYGIGKIKQCFLIDLQTLLSAWRNKLKENSFLFDEKFEWKYCAVSDNKVIYKDIVAEKIFCCEGVEATQNPYFNLLPFALNKGEALIAKIPGLPKENIFKQGISIVPFEEDDLFWIGSTYEWSYDNLKPTANFRKKVEEQLNYWLKLPYTIIDHWASVRPANIERRPFVGFHPAHSSVAILNGMGTKGCSLAPYFAYQLTENILYQTPLEPLADVKRFTRILSR